MSASRGNLGIRDLGAWGYGVKFHPTRDSSGFFIHLFVP